MELLTPHTGLLFWTLIVFAIVYFALKKFVWPSVLETVKKRETDIADAIAAAVKVKAEMELMKKENEQLLADARRQREELLKEANAVSLHIITEVRNETKAKCKGLVDDAIMAIQQQKALALKQALGQVEAIAAEASEKLLRRPLRKEGGWQKAT